jgi:23S rRNA (cytosine1962-C5)-methyltransferase
VQVKDHRQRLLGSGSSIPIQKSTCGCSRPTAFNRTRPFSRERIRLALEVRRRHLPGASSFRVVNAESDFLSGLIVDKYEDVLVVQISSLGMDQRKSLIVEALQRVFSPRAILERGDMASRKFEGLPDAGGLLQGQLEGPLTVNLNGLKFETDLAAGHKTGLYLDQQTNYQRVAAWRTGARCSMRSASWAAWPACGARRR